MENRMYHAEYGVLFRKRVLGGYWGARERYRDGGGGGGGEGRERRKKRRGEGKEREREMPLQKNGRERGKERDPLALVGTVWKWAELVFSKRPPPPA